MESIARFVEDIGRFTSGAKDEWFARALGATLWDKAIALSLLLAEHVLLCLALGGENRSLLLVALLETPELRLPT